MKILITGFEPFGGEEQNPSALLLEKLPKKLKSALLSTALLPVSFQKVREEILRLLEEEKPDVVICLGQAGGRDRITPERVAINLMDTESPDNDGFAPSEELQLSLIHPAPPGRNPIASASLWLFSSALSARTDRRQKTGNALSFFGRDGNFSFADAGHPGKSFVTPTKYRPCFLGRGGVFLLFLFFGLKSFKNDVVHLFGQFVCRFLIRHRPGKQNPVKTSDGRGLVSAHPPIIIGNKVRSADHIHQKMGHSKANSPAQARFFSL